MTEPKKAGAEQKSFSSPLLPCLRPQGWPTFFCVAQTQAAPYQNAACEASLRGVEDTSAPGWGQVSRLGPGAEGVLPSRGGSAGPGREGPAPRPPRSGTPTAPRCKHQAQALLLALYYPDVNVK